MTDTTDHIYQLQLKMWLEKTPAERLRQCMLDSEALFHFAQHAKPVTKSSGTKVIVKKSTKTAKFF